MNIHYAWFVWSLLLFSIWLLIYFILKEKDKKHEILVVSFWTALTGLSEPLFVPSYWNPPSLFDLAQKTGFDIESIVFSFGMGGLAVILYEWIFRTIHKKLPQATHYAPRHRHHVLVLFSTPIALAGLALFTNFNPIYSAILALTIGGLAAWYCRPDLKHKMFTSALIFFGIYFFYFLTLIALYPGYVEQVWNLKAVSGILITGIPLEELLFALSFGFVWSSVYEHMTWRTLHRTNRNEAGVIHTNA